MEDTTGEGEQEEPQDSSLRSWQRLSRRKRNSKVVSLDFKVPNVPSLPSEEEVWKWLGDLKLMEDEMHEVDYFEREIIEKKVYVCMKEETGADWLAEKFEEGLKYKVPQGQEVMIKGRKECELGFTKHFSQKKLFIPSRLPRGYI